VTCVAAAPLELDTAAISKPGRQALLVALCLAGATFLLFRRACDNGFINYDDPLYVTRNDHVQRGLSLASVAWSFSTLYFVNWHPLTWLSLLLDAQLYGPGQPWGYHLTNVVLHAVNAALLFLVLRQMTGATGCSALAAALFAVHPTHVEPVAWISARKDVLSTLFGLVTLGAYAYAVAKPSPLRRAAVIVSFALCLMSKPMLVTLPFLLLLLDYWPLARLHLGWERLVREKMPLFVLSALVAGVTWFAHQQSPARAGPGPASWLERADNAIGAYGFYIWKTLWPLKLMFPYPPVSGRERVVLAAAATALILALSVLVAKYRRRFPYLLVGWCWYVGTLVPVIGLVRAGMVLLADRYTYVPSIGLFIMIAWGGADLARHWRCPVVAASAGAAALALCAVGTRAQIGFWSDSVSLFGHTLAIDDANSVAHVQLAGALWEIGTARTRAGVPADDIWRDALTHYRRCAELDPGFQNHLNLGVALGSRGQLDEAGRELAAAVKLRPHDAYAWYALGHVLSRQGRFTDADAAFRKALEHDSEMSVALEELGHVLGREGKWSEATDIFRRVLARASAAGANRLTDHLMLAWSLAHSSQQHEAEEAYAAASAIDPSWTVTVADRAWQVATSPDAGQRDGFMAVELAGPASARAVPARLPRNLDILAAAYAEQGDWNAAIATAGKAQKAAVAAGQMGLAEKIRERRLLYRSRKPARADKP
jgi:tetratricopeptide (TPR) repeat protein